MRDIRHAFFLSGNVKYTFFLFIVIICGCKGCDPPDWTTYLSDQKGAILSPTPEKQLIVFIKPGTSREAFNKFLDTGIVKAGTLKIISVCGSCDSTLLMLEGSGVEAFINGEVAKGGSGSKTKATLSGENNLLYFTTNKSIGFDGLPDRPAGKKDYLQYNYQDSIILAVFDTGLEPGLFRGHLINGLPDTPCIPSATNGWNFFSWNNDWQDDNAGLHGTIVARYIIDEVERYKKTKANILPVKVFNSEGSTDLYTILCGFAYASHSGASIVNASFGYYESKTKFKKGEPTSDTTTVELLKNFISIYLTQKNILLVCAAGNRTDEDSTIRDLNTINFYPASLAASLSNIIPVTTVGNTGNVREVSPNQNFSSSIVQLGVDADFIKGDHFGFINPLDDNNDTTIAGSSFAAPIAAGKMAAYYESYKQLLKSTSTITPQVRDSIFNILFKVPSPLFLQTDRMLMQKVNGGKVIIRNSDLEIKFKGMRFMKGAEDKGLRIIKK